MMRWMPALAAALIFACEQQQTAAARPLPPWQYGAGKKGGMPGIGWFGANISGFENSSQLRMLGDYSMAVFGWQAFLDGDSYTGELDQLV